MKKSIFKRIAALVCAMIIAVLAMCTGCANNSSNSDESLADVKTSQYQQEISSSSQQETKATKSTAETESKKPDENTDEFDKSKIPEAPRNIKICMRYDNDDFMNFVGFRSEGALLYEDSAFGQFERNYIHLKDDKRQHVVLKKQTGFDFVGTPVVQVTGNAIEGIEKVKDSDTIFFEYGKAADWELEEKTTTYLAGDYPNHIVIGFCFDKDYIKDLNTYRFGRNDKMGEEHLVYRLGDDKKTVETILGKGYDYGNYSFYKNSYQAGDEMGHYYQVVEYKDNLVQRVYILFKEI